MESEKGVAKAVPFNKWHLPLCNSIALNMIFVFLQGILHLNSRSILIIYIYTHVSWISSFGYQIYSCSNTHIEKNVTITFLCSPMHLFMGLKQNYITRLMHGSLNIIKRRRKRLCISYDTKL